MSGESMPEDTADMGVAAQQQQGLQLPKNCRLQTCMLMATVLAEQMVILNRLVVFCPQHESVRWLCKFPTVYLLSRMAD